MSRRPLIAANFKMNCLPDGATDKDGPYTSTENVDVWVFPNFLDIKASVAATLFTGGQWGHTEPKGAYTGDISMQFLKDAGCKAVLCGHSERRQYHCDTNTTVAAQAQCALDVGLHPVICIGETAAQRDNNETESVLEQQLLPLPLDRDITIAYEPVWAIGTGVTPTPEEAQELHAFIRSKLSSEQQKTVRILYGGSMKPDNAKALLAQQDIDGGLIGSASLDPESFQSIVLSVPS